MLFMFNIGLYVYVECRINTNTRVPTATPEDDRGEKAEPRRYALLTLIRWPVSKFREFFLEIWVGPTFGRNSSKFGRPGAQERKGRTFEKVLCFASGLRIQDPRIHSH